MKRIDFIKVASFSAIAGSSCMVRERQNLIKKAVKLEMIISKKTLTEKFLFLKECGFDGVEVNSDSHGLDSLISAKTQSGLSVHCVSNADNWSKPITHHSQKIRQASVASLKNSIKFASALGAKTVNLNPGIMSSQDKLADCRKRALDSIQQVVPLLEKYQIKIVLQNLWNNFLQKPKELATFVKEINHPLVGVCLDTGNAQRFAPIGEWVNELGSKIFNVHLQAYSKLKAAQGKSLLFGYEPLRSKDYQGLRDTNFNGWVTFDAYRGARTQFVEFNQHFE
jgi:L-ribulose-5-phosphate 3-epimerase